jgi:hypothetical protein
MMAQKILVANSALLRVGRRLTEARAAAIALDGAERLAQRALCGYVK